MRKKNIKRILISGGWGYANFGDDAILISTINLIEKKFPGAEIVVSSYNVEETERNVNRDDIQFIPSIHRHLTGNLSAKRLIIVEKKDILRFNRNFVGRVFSKVKIRLKQIKYSIQEALSYRKYNLLLKDNSMLPLYEEYKSFDLFVQAGGGYFLGSWLDNLYSRVIELVIAKRNNLPILIMGQSIGPFNTKRTQEIALKGLQLANVISVRDQESVNELLSYQINSKLIPDTALYGKQLNRIKQATLTIIVGGIGMTERQGMIICKAVAAAAKLLGFWIKIIVTRLWYSDLNSAYRLDQAFKAENINATLIIPVNYVHLQNELATTSMIISQNLHGLIMGWRSGVPGISLSSGRKFTGFMEQSNQSHRLLPLERLSQNDLTECILDTGKNRDKSVCLQQSLSDKIEKDFDQCLDDLMQRAR